MDDGNSQYIDLAVSRADRRVRESLGYLQGHLSFLRRTGLDAEQRAALQAVEQSTSEIMLALEQLGDIVHGSSKEQAQSFRFDLKRSLHWVHRQFQGRAKSHGIFFALDVDAQTPSSLVGDARRLRSILISLLDNAIRYTQVGGVTLRVSSAGQPVEGEITIRFEVIDSGPGLSDELRRLLSDPAEPFTDDLAPSLATIQRWLASMGGRLIVQSTSSSGSHVAFELTFRCESVQEGSSLRTSLHGRRVLIVDQSLANRRLLERSLSHVGASHQSCSSLAESLAFLDSGELPDAMVLDGELAGTPGDEAATMLIEATGGSVPLLLLAHVATRGDGPRYRALGCRAYLVKPLHQEQILDALSAALSAGASEALITTHSLEETAQLSARVLLLADEPLVARQVERLLSEAGHGHRCSAPNSEGLRDIPPAERFELVLVDSPAMALGLLQELEQRFPGVPRIGLVSPDEMAGSKLLTQGFDELLFKPIRAWELSQVVLRWAGRELRRSTLPPTLEREPPIKIEVLDEATDGDRELQHEMISVFCEDVIASFESIEEALKEGRLKIIQTEAHSIKGSAPYFGADVFAELTQILENESERGDALRSSKVFEECRSEFERIQEFFKAYLGAGT